MKSLDEFVKKKRYLICVDSDGCAMDTMDVKHIRCFGPCMVKEWGLEEWQDQVLKRWNEINLYSMTRGINRFLALAQALTEVDKNLKKIDGIEKLVQWSETADELSNSSVKAAFEQSGEQIFLKAFDWSVAVNQAIGQLPGRAEAAICRSKRRTDSSPSGGRCCDCILCQFGRCIRRMEPPQADGQRRCVPDPERGKQGQLYWKDVRLWL